MRGVEVPMWRMMDSLLLSLENDEAFDCYKTEILVDINPDTDGMDPLSQRSRASPGSKKLPQDDGDSVRPKSLPDCLAEDLKVHQVHSHSKSPCKGATNRLKDVYNGLVTSKELLKVMGRVCHIEQQSSTTVSLFSALKLELDQACVNVGKLIVERRSNQSDVEILLKHWDKEKAVWKLKEQDRICGAVKSVAVELEIEKKLRRQTERLNKKLGTELADTKAALSKVNKELEDEKRTREILEQVCDELANGIGEDRAEVEELMKQFAQVQAEVEKEREMLQLADVLREERVYMKLSEARQQFEEKHTLVDALRNELESYLRSKRGEEQPDCSDSPQYNKIKELQAYLRETLARSDHYHSNENEFYGGHEDNNEADGDDLADNEHHSIKLNADGTNKSCQWDNNIISSNKNTGRRFTSERITVKSSISSGTNYSNGAEWEFSPDKQENADDLNHGPTFSLGSSKPWKKDIEDEIERYNMIKDLRDHIVSGSHKGSTQEFDGAGENLRQQSVTSNDPNDITCQG